MGGCITPPTKKQKVHKPDPPPKKPGLTSEPGISLDTTLNNMLDQNTLKQQEPAIDKPRLKKMSADQFCRIYRIQENVGTTVRVQGPKYVSNYADGIGRVLRVVPYGIEASLGQSSRDVDIQARIRAYSEILGLDLYEDDKGNMLILQDYYCGPYLE